MADLPNGMTDKQERFVLEYLKDLNGAQAAIRAGYSARTARQAATELLNENDEVFEAVEKAKAERMIRTQIDADYVVRNLTEIVERCLQRAPVMVKDGKGWVQAQDADGNDIWQFDAKGANGALTLLGKHLGLYIDRKEITLPQGTGVLAVPLPPNAEQWAAGAEAQQAALTAQPSVVEEKET